jgi:YD repeat-containing protein
VTAGTGTALPTITDEYNTVNGALEIQSTTVEGKTTKIKSVTNKLGQMTSYTDANEKTTTYEYDEDGRLHKLSDEKGSQTYTYENTTGELTELVNSAAGKFTALYNADEKIIDEYWPNGMTAQWTYNSTDQPTHLSYTKTSHCTTECQLLYEQVYRSIHNQLLTQSGSLAAQSYTYDNAGRLTEVQETPTEQGCTTRVYTFDEETNRTSMMTRNPNSENKCAGEGWATEHGSTETQSYDTANRLAGSGVTYDPWGDTLKLPAGDAAATNSRVPTTPTTSSPARPRTERRTPTISIPPYAPTKPSQLETPARRSRATTTAPATPPLGLSNRPAATGRATSVASAAASLRSRSTAAPRSCS